MVGFRASERCMAVIETRSDDDRRRGAWAQLHGHRVVKIGLTTESVLSFAR